MNHMMLGGLGMAHRQVGATRTPVITRNFNSDTPDTLPAGFTDLNGATGAVRASNPAATFHIPYSAMSDARDTGTFNANQYAKITLVGLNAGNSGDKIGVCLRLAATGTPNVNGYRIYVTNGGTGARSAAVYKVVNDTETIVGSSVTIGFVNGDTIEAEILSNLITVFRNGVSQFSRTDATFSTGNPGICGLESGATLFGDDYEAGDIT